MTPWGPINIQQQSAIPHLYTCTFVTRVTVRSSSLSHVVVETGQTTRHTPPRTRDPAPRDPSKTIKRKQVPLAPTHDNKFPQGVGWWPIPATTQVGSKTRARRSTDRTTPTRHTSVHVPGQHPPILLRVARNAPKVARIVELAERREKGAEELVRVVHVFGADSLADGVHRQRGHADVDGAQAGA